MEGSLILSTEEREYIYFALRKYQEHLVKISAHHKTRTDVQALLLKVNDSIEKTCYEEEEIGQRDLAKYRAELPSGDLSL